MTMAILITGASGFAGQHLIDCLLRHGQGPLHGLSRQPFTYSGMDHNDQRYHHHACDLLDEATLRSLLNRLRPQRIYHLAGSVDPAQSLKDPDTAWEGNLRATQILYEAIIALGLQPRILHVSTGAVYGDVRSSVGIITESTELRPNTPYAASKAAADLLSYQLHRTHDLPIIRARPFNFVGPGLPERFALAHFAKQIAAIENGKQPPLLRVGQLQTERDLLDVRDLVEAYVVLMERGDPGEVYNLARGQAFPMGWYLEHMLAQSSAQVQVEVDRQLLRTTDTATVRVDVSLMRNSLGWQPRFDLAQTMLDVLNDYRGLRAAPKQNIHEPNSPPG